jgi:hypothetical protein
MTTNRRSFIREALASSFVATVSLAMPLFAKAQSPSPGEARQIAEDAYVIPILATSQLSTNRIARISPACGFSSVALTLSRPTFESPPSGRLAIGVR